MTNKINGMEYEGLEILTNEKVYDPAEDSILCAEVISGELEKLGGSVRVLDMGCGSGILGLYAASKPNVSAVVFADKDDNAVELCRRNIETNRDMLYAQCDVVKSDLFSDVTGKFDLILFNSPYLPEGKGDKLANAWYGGESGVEVAIKFVKQAPGFMEEGGEIVLAVSSAGNVDMLVDEVIGAGLYVASERRSSMDFEDIIVMVISRQDYIGS